MRSLSSVFVAITLCVVSGCGSSASSTIGTVSGQVTFSGQPVKAGEVTLYSPGAGSGATAAIDGEGHYQFQEPLPAGDYQVAVLPPPPPPPQDAVPVAVEVKADDIPGKYRDFNSSGLTLSVKPGDNTFDISMTP